MILRKFQYDIVSSYYYWYLMLITFKLISIIAILSKFWSIIPTESILVGIFNGKPQSGL